MLIETRDKPTVVDLTKLYVDTFDDHVPRLRKHVDQMRHKWGPSRRRIEDKLKQQIQRLDKTFNEESVASRVDKIWFAVSVLNIFWFGVFIGSMPQWVHVIYTVQLAILLPIRFYTFFCKDWQYYLADLCYFVNLITMLYIWVWPQSSFLWISSYAFSFGTLCLAVVLWRNSFVLHSVEKTTSTVIHVLPPVILHTINFRIPNELKRSRFPGALSVGTWTGLRSVMITTVTYLLWQLFYHYFITIRCREHIARGRITSFEFLRRKYAKAWVGKFVNSLPGHFPHVAYALIQFGLQLLTMVPIPLFYHYEWLSTAYLIAIFSVASYNGASYYVDVFGKRFHKELVKLQKELENDQYHKSSVLREASSKNNILASEKVKMPFSTSDPFECKSAPVLAY